MAAEEPYKMLKKIIKRKGGKDASGKEAESTSSSTESENK